MSQVVSDLIRSIRQIRVKRAFKAIFTVDRKIPAFLPTRPQGPALRFVLLSARPNNTV